MKIAVFHNLPPGGAQRVVDQQLKFLARHHSVKLFHQPVILSGHRFIKDYHNFITLAQQHQRLVQQINQNFDLCLAHPDQLTQAPFLLKFLTIPSMYYCHEWLRLVYEPELAPPPLPFPKQIYEHLTRLLRKKIDYLNTRSASLILANSNHTAKNIRQAYHRQAIVCYPGVDTQVFKPSPQKRQQILFIGQKHRLNGWGLAQKLNQPLKVIDQHNLSDSQLAKEYSRSLCVLCLSINEPFGLVPLEAMACQTPVLAVNQAGYQETVLHQQTGYLLPRKTQEFSKIIKRLKNNPNLVQKLGRQGRQHVKKHFTWHQHHQTLINQIEKLTHEA